jgi:hypothetical protein
MQKIWLVKVQVKHVKSQRVKVTRVTTTRVTCGMIVRTYNDDMEKSQGAMWYDRTID